MKHEEKTLKMRVLQVQVALVVAVAALWPVTAFAQDGEATVSGDEFLSLDPGTVRLIIAVVIPILVGVVTKASWSGMVKGLLLLVLNFVNAAVIAATLADGHAAWDQATLREALIGFVISVAMYFGIYEPANLTSQEGGKLANIGIKD